MRSQKRYTDVYFKKRVDHESGHKPRGALEEPSVCRDCGAIYVDRRWNKAGRVSESKKHPHFRPPQQVVCPACVQVQEGIPAGFLYLKGRFVTQHLEQIQRLLESEAGRAEENNPLSRIMRWTKEGDGSRVVETTTEHLAQRLGKALESAFKGEVIYDFSHENKLTRVTWTRE